MAEMRKVCRLVEAVTHDAYSSTVFITASVPGTGLLLPLSCGADHLSIP